ncbi:MAG: hypothetical protein QOG15_1693 [Solirubrobacteraceae bacterium]|jgi:hypothetical protein|nr:hypothetical protein [Solirubrobacteraceae bacterium]
MPSPAIRILAALLAVAACLALSACGSAKTTKTTTTTGPLQLGPAFPDIAKLPGALTTKPPWPANNDSNTLQLRLRKIGLPALNAEGQVVHIHQHLDLFANGEPVTVPAQIGIDAAGAYIAPLHTHDATGVLHVESPTVATFTLGQIFAVWGVRLDRTCIGGLCAGGGKQLRVWVNGKPLNADPTRIELAAHEEIVIAYGTPAQMPKSIPSSYAFGADL